MTYHHLIKTLCVATALVFVIVVLIATINLKKDHINAARCASGIAVLDAPCPLVSHER